jgi:hypothetical protein
MPLDLDTAGRIAALLGLFAATALTLILPALRGLPRR